MIDTKGTIMQPTKEEKTRYMWKKNSTEKLFYYKRETYRKNKFSLLNKNLLRTALWMLLCCYVNEGSLIYRCPQPFSQRKGFVKSERDLYFLLSKRKINYVK